MPTANNKLVRKGKPSYVMQTEEKLAQETSAGSALAAHRSRGSAAVTPAKSANLSTTNGATSVVGPSATAPRAAFVTTPAHKSVALSERASPLDLDAPVSRTQRRTATAAARVSLYRHKDVAPTVHALLQLLLRSRRSAVTNGGDQRGSEERAEASSASVAASELAAAVQPPAPEELRPVLDSIRDYCVAQNNKSKFESGTGVRSQPSTAAARDADLNGFYAVTFLSSLFFANDGEDIVRDSLESAVSRLRAAEAHGREELYHNAIVETVNSILLFTPLTAPPVWLLAGVRQSVVVSAQGKRGGRSASSVAPSGFGAPSRRAGAIADTASESMIEDIAAVVRAMLYKLDHAESPQEDEAGGAGTDPDSESGVSAGRGTSAERDDPSEVEQHTHVLEDDCIDYLSTESGSATFVEQQWFDVWLSTLLRGYVNVVTASLDAQASNAEPAEDGAIGDAESSSESGAIDEYLSAFASVPTLLPRPVWRSAASNVYAQFAVQLLAIFFARGSDGSLNYCARVHRLVQFYSLRLRGHGECDPIASKNAARPPAPPMLPSQSVRRARRAEPEREAAPPALAHVLPEVSVAEDDDDDGAEEEKQKKLLLMFRPTEGSRRRAGRGSGEEPAAAPEPPLERLYAEFTRRHKCYTEEDTVPFEGRRTFDLPPEEATESP